MSSPPPYPGSNPQDPGQGYPQHGHPDQPTQQHGQQPYGGQQHGQQPYGGYPERPAHEAGGYGGGYGPPAEAPRNGIGIAALVFGVLAFLTGIFLIGGLFGLVAIALGIIGISRAAKGRATNRGVAITGLVLGVIGIVLTVVVVVFFSNLFTAVGGADFVDCVQRAGGDQAAVAQCQAELEQRVLQESEQLGGS